MFDNRKIKHLRRLPDGNSIVLIWIMLLTIAGRCNAGGKIFLTESIPYTVKMLSDDMGFRESMVSRALEAMENLEMIFLSADGFLTISGWEEHQNIDGMDKIREQNRIRKQKQRDNQKNICETSNMSRDSHGTVTQCHATEEEIEEEREKDIEVKKENKRKKRVTKQYGSLGNVTMTEEEYHKLRSEYGADADAAIEFLGSYIAEKGYKSKSHYLSIRRWVIDAIHEPRNQKRNVMHAAGASGYMGAAELEAIKRTLGE